MDDLSSIYSEKKLAYYETIYKEGILSKPQDVNLSVTAAHLYGLAFICEQVGTKEEDPTYTRFSCGFEEITKIYINNNNKNSPIYIQCDENTKGVLNRRRIILPCFSNNDEIVRIITNAKTEFDKKTEKQRESEKNKRMKELEEQKLREHERIKKAADAEFESITSDYTKNLSKASDFDVSDILGLDDIISPVASGAVVDIFTEPEPKEEIIEEKAIDISKPANKKPKPAPAPAPAPAPEPIPEPIEEISVPISEQDDVKTECEISSVSEPIESEDEVVVESTADELTSADVIAANEEAEMIDNEISAEQISENSEPEPISASSEEQKEHASSMYEAYKSNAKKIEKAPEPVHEEKKASEVVEEEEITPKNMSLEEFQTAVMKLKSMLDNGLIDNDEFAVEKKKLLKLLY